MTTTERNALARIFSEAGRLLRATPVEATEPEPQPEPKAEIVKVSDPQPEPVADAEPEPIVLEADADDTRYASRRQRGLIAGLTETDYISSKALRRTLAGQVIAALFTGATVHLPDVEVTLTMTDAGHAEYLRRQAERQTDAA